MNIYLKILVIAFVLIIVVSIFQLVLSSKPFSQATNEICCLSPDGSLSYILGNDCANEKHGKIVDEQLCYDYFLKD